MPRFAKYAWGVLTYNLAVVLWGAYVRASGAGAGCGRHWPLCNGVVIPQPERIQTLIEFTHRVMSGVALLLVIGLVVWSRAAPRGHPARGGALASLGFMLSEALVGAWLVLYRLVEHDASMTRAVSLSVHLVNTFLLLAALGLTAWWASGGPRVGLRGRGALPWLVAAGLAGTLAVGMTGAVAALGDTLFPSSSLLGGLREDASPTAHLLIRLRVLHPTLAILVGFYLLGLSLWLARAPARGRAAALARAMGVLVLLQLLLGGLNVALLAPVWLQLVHLLAADLVWLALVLSGAAALAEPAAVASQRGGPRGAALAGAIPTR